MTTAVSIRFVSFTANDVAPTLEGQEVATLAGRARRDGHELPKVVAASAGSPTRPARSSIGQESGTRRMSHRAMSSSTWRRPCRAARRRTCSCRRLPRRQGQPRSGPCRHRLSPAAEAAPPEKGRSPRRRPDRARDDRHRTRARRRACSVRRAVRRVRYPAADVDVATLVTPPIRAGSRSGPAGCGTLPCRPGRRRPRRAGTPRRPTAKRRRQRR